MPACCSARVRHKAPRQKDQEAKLAETYAIRDSDVLLVVDVQNDFCPGGALAVPQGAEIVTVVNRLAKNFRNVVLTQDWHPAGHLSFASSHAGKKPFEVIAAPYGPQELWPDHCVQDTPGAEFRRDFLVPRAELIVRKGFRREIDSYSAFYENDHATPTGLTGYLKERGFTRVFLAGLAFGVAGGVAGDGDSVTTQFRYHHGNCAAPSDHQLFGKVTITESGNTYTVKATLHGADPGEYRLLLYAPLGLNSCFVVGDFGKFKVDSSGNGSKSGSITLISGARYFLNAANLTTNSNNDTDWFDL